MDIWRMKNHLFQRKMQQTYDAINCFEKMFKFFKPKRIVEIGAGKGGLSIFLGIHAALMDAKAISIDREDYMNTEDIFRKLSLPTQFLISDYKLIFDECVSFAHEDSPALILCDNGSKEEELALFAPHLRPGDVMMGHDYKIEIREEVVEDIIKKHKLEYFYQNRLWGKCDSRWVCLRKKI